MDDNIRDWIAGFNSEALLADGFDEAIMGVAERCGEAALVLYDTDKCIAILMERDGMDYEGAVEFFDFNVVGAWVGKNTPMFLRRRE